MLVVRPQRLPTGMHHRTTGCAVVLTHRVLVAHFRPSLEQQVHQLRLAHGASPQQQRLAPLHGIEMLQDTNRWP